MKMELIGPGVYLMKWGKGILQPKQVLSVIHGTLGSAVMEEAAKMFLNFSVRHNAWCGVAWPRLLKEMRSKYKKQPEFEGVKRAIEVMVNGGLLEIPTDHNKWYSRWLNVFSPRIVCPTNFLINMIWTKKSRG